MAEGLKKGEALGKKGKDVRLAGVQVVRLYTVLASFVLLYYWVYISWEGYENASDIGERYD